MLPKVSILAAVISAASFSAFAVEKNSNFNFVEVGYGQLKLDDFDEIKPKGVVASFAYQYESVYFTGSYLRGTDEYRDGYYERTSWFEAIVNTKVDVTASQFLLGVGHIAEISDSLTFDVSVSVGRVKADAEAYTYVRETSLTGGGYYEDQYWDSASASATFYKIDGRLTKTIGDFVLKGMAGAEDAEDTDVVFAYGVEASYFLTPSWSLSPSYRNADDYNITAGTVRYHF